MAKKLAIGHIDCSFCGFDAEVKISDKSLLAYTFCPDCNAQSFCRTKYQHEKLLAKMRPVTVTENLQPIESENTPPVVEKKTGFNLGAL